MQSFLMCFREIGVSTTPDDSIVESGAALVSFHELDVAVLSEKPEIAYKIKVHRPKFHLREMNDLGERPMPIAPV